MQKVLISILFISTMLYSSTLPRTVDIIDIKILKEGDKVTINRAIKTKGKVQSRDSQEVSHISNRPKVITVSIPSPFYKGQEYKSIKVLNEKEIKSKFLIVDDKLKVFIPQREYLEVFKLEAEHMQMQ